MSVDHFINRNLIKSNSYPINQNLYSLTKLSPEDCYGINPDEIGIDERSKMKGYPPSISRDQLFNSLSSESPRSDLNEKQPVSLSFREALVFVIGCIRKNAKGHSGLYWVAPQYPSLEEKILYTALRNIKNRFPNNLPKPPQHEKGYQSASSISNEFFIGAALNVLLKHRFIQTYGQTNDNAKDYWVQI